MPLYLIATGKVMMLGDVWTGNKYFYLYSI